VRRVDDLDSLLRVTYGYIRRHGSTVARGRAYFLWKHALGKRPTTFIASTNGVLWRNDRVALLAELRLVILRENLPVECVMAFNRHV
jgi:hypothetical protein